MARIMFMANAPWCTTGYGVQGKHLTPRLKALGHEVAYFAFYGLQNGMLTQGGVPVYPQAQDMWGGDVLPGHMQDFRADTLITLLDVWVSQTFSLQTQRYGWRWLPWTPIDCEPVPEVTLEHLQGAHTVLPYSRFGEAQLRDAGVENVRYVPHGVSDLFQPGDKARARKIFGIPEDAFVIGMVAANKSLPSRKAFPEQMQAFARFRKRHPQAVLYLHTLANATEGGVNTRAIAQSLGIDEAVIWSNQYQYVTGFPEEAMAELYRSFDVLSLVSMNEGFGLPLIEAQACGVPVVTLARTSMTELCFGGELVQRAQLFWWPLNAWVYMPEVGAIDEAYEQMFQRLSDPAQARQVRDAAIAGAEPYRWDRIVQDYWQPILANLEVTQ